MGTNMESSFSFAEELQLKGLTKGGETKQKDKPADIETEITEHYRNNLVNLTEYQKGSNNSFEVTKKTEDKNVCLISQNIVSKEIVDKVDDDESDEEIIDDEESNEETIEDASVESAPDNENTKEIQLNVEHKVEGEPEELMEEDIDDIVEKKDDVYIEDKSGDILEKAEI